MMMLYALGNAHGCSLSALQGPVEALLALGMVAFLGAAVWALAAD